MKSEFLSLSSFFRLGMRFRLWNRHFFSGLWLGAFGKVWLFRCQSRTLWRRNTYALCKRLVPRRFLLLSARGWRTSRGIFCVVFFCFIWRFWGLLGSQGEPGFYFFLPGFCCSPIKKTCIFLLRKCRFKLLCGRPDLNWHSSRH